MHIYMPMFPFSVNNTRYSQTGQAMPRFGNVPTRGVREKKCIMPTAAASGMRERICPRPLSRSAARVSKSARASCSSQRRVACVSAYVHARCRDQQRA